MPDENLSSNFHSTDREQETKENETAPTESSDDIVKRDEEPIQVEDPVVGGFMNKMRDFFHKTSKYIVNFCILHNIGTIGIGYNENWKQKVSLSKISNQSFVSIPFLQLIRQLKYKA